MRKKMATLSAQKMLPDRSVGVLTKGMYTRSSSRAESTFAALRLGSWRQHLCRNFHFGLPNLIQYKPKRHPLVLRAAFFFPEPFPTLQDGALALLAKSKIANSRLFNAFHKHP